MEAKDYHHASFLYQHGDKGKGENFRRAFELSMKAAQLGMPLSETIILQAFDKYILSKQIAAKVPFNERTQRFGTQSDLDDEGKRHTFKNDGKATEEDAELFGRSKDGTPLPDSVRLRNEQVWHNMSSEEKDSRFARINLQFLALG